MPELALALGAVRAVEDKDVLISVVDQDACQRSVSPGSHNSRHSSQAGTRATF
jgi:hypothetical protein